MLFTLHVVVLVVPIRGFLLIRGGKEGREEKYFGRDHNYNITLEELCKGSCFEFNNKDIRIPGQTFEEDSLAPLLVSASLLWAVLFDCSNCLDL